MKAATQLTNHYFRVEHTGGGCRAWWKDSPDESHYALITDESGIALGDDVKKPQAAKWLVGIYDTSGENWICGSVTGLSKAIAWCETALALPNPLQASMDGIEQ